MAKRKIAAYLVPRADEHQGEYVAACSERLAWLTGFTGSAGLAIVTRKQAGLFVDGRYTVQAPGETDTDVFTIEELTRPRIKEWLSDTLRKGQAVGFDPMLHTCAEIAQLKDGLARKGAILRPLATNLVDAAWGDDRPDPPVGNVSVQPLKYAGTPAKEKIAAIQKTLKDDGQDAVVLTLPDSICWLLNIRGSDIAHNPVALSYAIVPASGKPSLFINPKKLDAAAKKHLASVAKLNAPGDLRASMRSLRQSGKTVRLDFKSAAAWFSRSLNKSQIIDAADPCIGPKAAKNSAEIEGSRAAHLRDGAAMCRFLAWLDANGAEGITEIDAVKVLEGFRAETGELRDISFDTIAGSGPNGAIVHYRVNEKSNRRLKRGELFLVDSGGQYADGTTDITRTVAIGKPSREMAERFTLVLKGHIAIATARFPKATRGVDLDVLARAALWGRGLDYAHGTGHGVGSYLSVHEGPQSISRAGMVSLEPGMICSNEPGYYKTGAYGIRIENLVVVREPEMLPDGEREMMSFETLTLAPVDLRLVVPELMTPEEMDWLDTYHARVRAEIGPLLTGSDKDWLTTATECMER